MFSIFSKIFQADFVPQQFRNSRKYTKASLNALKKISRSSGSSSLINMFDLCSHFNQKTNNNMKMSKQKRYSEIMEARQLVNVQPEDSEITKLYVYEVQNKHVKNKTCGCAF